MRLSYFIVCATVLTGCASHAGMPVANAGAAASAPNPDTSVEVRHMYLFAPGKRPVLIVEREESPGAPQEVSSEPPNAR